MYPLWRHAAVEFVTREEPGNFITNRDFNTFCCYHFGRHPRCHALPWVAGEWWGDRGESEWWGDRVHWVQGRLAEVELQREGGEDVGGSGLKCKPSHKKPENHALETVLSTQTSTITTQSHILSTFVYIQHTSAFGKFPTHASEIKMKTTLEHTLPFDITDMKHKKRRLRVFENT